MHLYSKSIAPSDIFIASRARRPISLAVEIDNIIQVSVSLRLYSHSERPLYNSLCHGYGRLINP